MSGSLIALRYCTGCCRRKRHSNLWFGTYCVRCRLRSIPRRWKFQARARYDDWRQA